MRAVYDWRNKKIAVYGVEKLNIKGARKGNGRYLVPLHKADEVLSIPGISATDGVREFATSIKEPEERIWTDESHIFVQFPKDASSSRTAKEMGGIKYLGAPIGAEIYRFSRSKEHQVRTIFSDFGEKVIARHVNSRSIVLPDLTKPTPNGWTLFEHQRWGVKRLLKSDRGRILAFGFGTGKSYTSSVTAMILQQQKGYDVLVVCPASLQDNWAREMEDLVGNPHIFSDHFSSIPEGHDRPFVLIADEAHRLAGEDSKRGEKFLELAEQAEFVIPVTGVPVRHGDPTTAWPLLRSVNHPIATEVSREAFEARFSGYEANIKAFWELTKDDILLKTKEECLDLPEETRILRYVDASAKDLERYEKHLKTSRDAYREAVGRGEKLPKYIKSAMVHFIRKAASLAKVGTTIEITEELLGQDRQVVIFVAYQETGQKIIDHFGRENVAVIRGDVPREDRQRQVDEFQAGEKKIIVCSFGAAGYGLTLTAAADLILVDRPFSVEGGDTDNAESRIRRIGQDKPVTYIWLQFKHPRLASPDERLDEMILDKYEKNQLALTGKKEELDLVDYTIGHLFGGNST